MTDYGTPQRQRFLRQLKYMAWLRALYVAAVGVAVGSTLAAIITVATRGHQ